MNKAEPEAWTCAECGDPVQTPSTRLKVVAVFCKKCSKYKITPKTRIRLKQ